MCENDEIDTDDLQLHSDSRTFSDPSAFGDSSALPVFSKSELEASRITTPTNIDNKTNRIDYPARCAEYSSLDDYLLDVEKEVLCDALEKVRWNKTLAAKRLGITFRSLRYRLQKLGLDDE